MRVPQKHRKTATETLEDVSPERLIDLANLVLAFDTYAKLLSERGSNPDDTYNHGMTMIRRFLPQLMQGVSRLILPLADKAEAARFKHLITLAQRTGAPALVASHNANLFAAILPWLVTHGQTFRGIFTGRAATVARQVALLADEESLPSRLNKAAALPSVSGMTTSRKWIERTAELAGAPVSQTDALAADADEAKTLGETIRGVDAKLRAAGTNTPQAAELQEKKAALAAQVADLAAASTEPAVVKSIALTEQTKASDYTTDTGKRLKMTPDQEDAMTARGRVVIAAGAGSGKTRVLAGKVVYHMNELDVDATAVLASSFTTKASAELIKRIKDYGGVIDGATDGFGTTHSIAGKILNSIGRQYRRPNYIGKKEGYKQTTLLRLAMAQVKIRASGAPPAPTEAIGLWQEAQEQANAPEPVSTPAQSANRVFTESVQDALGYFNWAYDVWDVKFRPWLENSIDFLRDIQGRTPGELTPRQKELVNNLFAKVKRRGVNSITYRVAAAEDEGDEATPEPVPEDTAKRDKMSRYTFYKTPANQWFNLGLALTKGGDGKEKAVAIPVGQFKNAISIFKGKGLSPSEAWVTTESPEAAVYAAYEWLKGPQGEPEFQSYGDMDDILIDTVRALVASPSVRSTLQNRYKVVLVDEAQDLNRVQHILFSLIAGYLDPQTLQPTSEKKMTADTFALIGDDKQCVEANTLISMADGTLKKASDIQPGDRVLSWRNGTLTAQTIQHAVSTSWEEGYQVLLESGKSLTMSPNHKLWATDPQTEEDQVAVYLMYRPDMGYRVGITNKGKVGSEGDYLNSYGGRCFLEKAERLWILDICQNREDALTKEAQYSLRYGIPTTVFNGEHRDLNQDRINTLFSEFGTNGLKLLTDRHLSANLPHWMSQSYTKHDRERHTLNLIAHTGSGTQVAMEWSGNKFDVILADCNVKETTGGRRRLRRWFNNYREALQFAELVVDRTGANFSQRLSTPEAVLRKITASGLHAGMKLPVLEDDGTLSLESITSICKVEGSFRDLDVDDASNFFGNQVLTSNSIYEFRGADPEEFIDRSSLTEGGDDFDTKMLDTNFRSGRVIVEAANSLIAHNKKQIPMTCRANIDRKGEGFIASRKVADTKEAAIVVAEEVADAVKTAMEGTTKYKDFGIGVRSNAEAYAYGVQMLVRGIPFKSNANFFNDRNTKALIGWLTIAEFGLDGPPDKVNPAVIDATSAPYSNLGPTFKNTLEAKGQGNWAGWLVQGGHGRIYSRPDMAELVQHFTDNIEKVSAFTGSPQEVLNQVLMLLGADGQDIRQSMLKALEEDDVAMTELAAETDNGKVTREQMEERAFAPIAPLVGLMEHQVKLGEAMTYVRKLKVVNDKLASRDTDAEIDRDAVTISTMHGWKGLEVPHMFIPVVGGRFPRCEVVRDSKGKTEMKPVAEESPALWSERRLAYVAITRAENHCVLLDIPNPTFGVRSQFFSEACIPSEESQAGRDAVASSGRWTPDRIRTLLAMTVGLDLEDVIQQPDDDQWDTVAMDEQWP